MENNTEDPIAIIGAGCHFPGDINNTNTYWQSLLDGVNAITEVPKDRWDLEALFAKDPKSPGKTYATHGGFLSNIDQFDPEFFKITPREAAHIDPQQRLLLETAYEAMEDAGESPQTLSEKKTGVYVGIFIHDYQHMQLSERNQLNAHTGTGTAMSIAANRISYVFNLNGPSMAVDTACSSSLLSIHLACQSIRSGECDTALAGGVNVIIKPEMTIAMSKATMLSPDGRCFSFDSRANGYVRGEGAGLVLLKPLSEAIKDKNPIYSVIIASACNQDGKTVGISVPNGNAQEALLKKAIKNAKIKPSDIGYIEAHGTGTPVGDPIEANALGNVLSKGRDNSQPCVIGSVKSNMGHLESASGIAGLLKASLILKNGKIPKNLNFQEVNPKINLSNLKLRVLTENENWQQNGARIAGVNSFGFGGTNVHVLLQEPPNTDQTQQDNIKPRPTSMSREGLQVIKLSAHSPEALRELARQTSSYIADNSPNLNDLAYTLNTRRGDHDYRVAWTVENLSHLQENITEHYEKNVSVPSANIDKCTKGPLFVFTGMGPQWWAMGRELLLEERLFRETIETCDAAFKPLTGWSLLEELTKNEDSSRIQDTTVAQPAIFSIQIALWSLWQSWGIKPSSILGHSVGEIAAAYAAGALSFQEAILITYHRSQLQSRMRNTGAMLAAGVSEETIRELFPSSLTRVSFAAVNSPVNVTLSGDKTALMEIAKELENRDHFVRFLKVEVPYHSFKMDPIKEDFLSVLSNLKPQATTTPFISTITGDEIPGTQLNAEYWWKNIRQPVYFSQSLITWSEQFASDDLPPIVEIGPHPVLSSAISECLSFAKKTTVNVHSLRRGQAESAHLLQNLIQLYQQGCKVDWQALSPEGRFLKLHGYPWQRISCWAESENTANARKGYAAQTMVSTKGKAHPLLGQRLHLASAIWNQTISLDRYSFLSDHKIQNEVVFPGAGYIEMIASALNLEWDKEHCVINNLSLSKALFIPDAQALTLQCHQGENNRFDISAKKEDQEHWDKHCHAKAYKQTSLIKPVFNLDEIKARCHKELPTEYLYALFEYIGFGYGTYFQRIRSMYQGQNECLARIENVNNEDGHGYHFHPAWLDANLHAIFGALSLTAEDADIRDQAYLPVSIQSVQLFSPANDKYSWSHAQITKRSKHSFSANVTVYDESGRPLLNVKQLRCEAIDYSNNKLQRNSEKWLYHFEWKSEALPRNAASSSYTWLIFVNEKSAFIADILSRENQSVIVVSIGNSFRKNSVDSYHINPTDSAHYQKLIDDIEQSGRAIHHVVHSLTYDNDFDVTTSSKAILARQNIGFGSIIYFLQSQESLSDKPQTFTIVSCNGFDCKNEKPINVDQSHWVGLTRVMGNEIPDVVVRCVDLGIDISDLEKQLLYNELTMNFIDEEVALRNNSRYVRRLVRWQSQELETHVPSDNKAFALDVKHAGDINSLQYIPIATPFPMADEVAITVSHAALNFKDVLKASGLFPIDLMEENLWSGDGLGMECAGVVTALGSEVKNLEVGTRVMALAPKSLQSHTIAKADLVVPINNLASYKAAAIPMVFLTAYYGLVELARLTKGERILIHAAAGGVGLAAIQLARWQGAEIYATCGSDQKRQFLKSLGIKYIYNSRSSSFAQDLLKDTGGEGVDVVLNSLAGSFIDLSLSLLRDYGRFVEIGKMDIHRDKTIGMKPFHYNLSFFSVDLDRMLKQRPQLCGSMLKTINQLIATGKIEPIKTTTYSGALAPEAFRAILSSEHIGKLVVSLDKEDIKTARSLTPVFDAEASYLITGGLGGFGSSLAHWLVDHGCRYITLLGRRGVQTLSAKRLIKELNDKGANVKIIQADVSQEDSLVKIKSALEPSHPLKGIFHAAGVLDDALLLKQDMEKFDRVAATKIAGSWNLHQLSQNLQLDHFVMFSSVATTLGNQGSGNYATVNAFMDGLAHFRRQQGLVALSINWGVIADVGMAADEDFYRRSLEENGLRALHSRNGLDLLGLMLCENETQITISPIDWEKWLRFNPAGEKTRFNELIQAQSRGQISNQSTEEKTLREKLSAAAPDAIKDVATTEIQNVLAKFFGSDTKRILPEKTLTSLGMDSLMAVELKARLDRFGVAIPVAALLRDMSVLRIVDHLLSTYDLSETKEDDSHEKSIEKTAGHWIVVPDPKPNAKYRMFCFPYAGAGPVVYQQWQAQLSPEIEVCAIHLPGRGSRLDESPLKRIPEMRDAIVDAMAQRLDKPLLFFGHCMGAIVMYEVIAQIKQIFGIEAVHIFVSGCMAPHLYNSPLVYGLEQQKFLDVLNLISFTSAGAMHKDEEVVELMSDMLRSDFEAVAHYAQTKTKNIVFSAPITGFAAKHDLFAAPSAMRAWAEYTDQEFKLNMLIGDHYFIESDQDVLIEALNRTLGYSINQSVDLDRFEALSIPLKNKTVSQDNAINALTFIPLEKVNPKLFYWIDSYNPKKNTLFCFPGAWETLALPEYIPHKIDEDWQIAIVQYPGHGLRVNETCNTEMVSIINEVSSALINYTDKPFAFLGHCVGGLIQYEVAKKIKASECLEPLFLITSAVVNPEIYTAPNGHLLNDEKLIELLTVVDCPLASQLHENSDHATHLFELIRADLELMATFVGTEATALHCPITAVTGKNDLWTYPLQAASWLELTQSEEKVMRFHEGTHFLNHEFQTLFLELICQRIRSNTLKNIHEPQTTINS